VISSEYYQQSFILEGFAYQKTYYRPGCPKTNELHACRPGV